MAVNGSQNQAELGNPASLEAELDQLRAEVQQLRSERTSLIERQQRVMDLIGTARAENLLHDIRNVLNERALLRTLTEGQF